MNNNWMEKLNEQQLTSVVICDKPLRVVAGAGSGKTRVITTKISYLITDLEIHPSRILAVTFTNKAANEMKERVREMTAGAVEPFISTFHAMCTRILRIESENCGLSKNFLIIDESQRLTIMRRILGNLNIEVKSAKEVKNFFYPISDWKNSLITPPEAHDKAVTPSEKTNARVYKAYEDLMAQNNYVDFDDLLLKVHKLFRENTTIRNKWHERFDYILVDEFQDTNQIQFDIICWLNGDNNTITVVGDPDQTIYTWRGAEMHIILDFDKKFKNSVTINLEENYRSTQKILSLANSFISHNKERIDKKLFSTNDNDYPLKLASAQSAAFEARYVANQIKELVDSKKYRYMDIYVLYRINSLSGNFERSFANSKIPYQVVGGLNFRDRKVIKDISSMLIAVVAQDSYATERVLETLPKVGPATVARLQEAADEYNVTLFNLLTKYGSVATNISKFVESCSTIFAKAKTMYDSNSNVLDIAKYMVDSFDYVSTLKVKDENYENNREHINAYFDQMREFDVDFTAEEHGTENRLEAFCQSDLLGKNGIKGDAIEDAVSLMTIHAAKGLENKVVFVVGLNEGIFPSKRSYFSLKSLEEERRTLYVAITRAKETLYLTYVDGEFSYQVNGNLHGSRFIDELDTSLLEKESNIFFHSLHEMSSFHGEATEDSTISKLPVDLKPGDHVTHGLFGEGIVTKILNRQFIAAFNDPKWKVQTVPINSGIWRKI